MFFFNVPFVNNTFRRYSTSNVKGSKFSSSPKNLFIIFYGLFALANIVGYHVTFLLASSRLEKYWIIYPKLGVLASMNLIILGLAFALLPLLFILLFDSDRPILQRKHLIAIIIIACLSFLAPYIFIWYDIITFTGLSLNGRLLTDTVYHCR